MIYKAGEKPGKGTYVCTTCGYTEVLDNDNAILPSCPVCGDIEYEKK
jgi:rubrerythrin